MEQQKLRNNEYRKAYYEANKEKVKEANKLYYQNQFYDPKNMVEFSKNINSAHEKINYDIKGFGLMSKEDGKINNHNIRNDFFFYEFVFFTLLSTYLWLWT